MSDYNLLQRVGICSNPVRGENFSGDQNGIGIYTVVWKQLKKDVSHVAGESYLPHVSNHLHVTENKAMHSPVSTSGQ